MNANLQRFDRAGLLALDPRAFGVVVSQSKPPARAVERIGRAAVVSITGPLEHHVGEGYCDSYEDITRRVAEACASDAKAVVLRADSPGGLVSGCFATALALRSMCDAAGKLLHAFVSGSASSAMYALISQADSIVLGVGCTVGSIGIIDARLDVTKQDAALGMRFAFITSGERKADGNPHLPISSEELAVRQDIVDDMASVFFGLVAQKRPTSAAKLSALQAGVFLGQDAIDHGLADEIGTFEGLLASIAAEPQPPAQASQTTEQTMGMRKALEEAAKGEGEEAKKAKRALAAYDNDEAAAADDDGDGEGAESEEEPAEDDEEKKKKKDEEARAAAAAASAASAPAAAADPLAEIRAEQISSFLDTRPDLTAQQRASVQGLPVAKVREIVNAIPKSKAPKLAALAATSMVTGTRGEGQGDGSESRLPPEQKAALDAQMGLSAITYTGVVNTPHMVVLGAPVAKPKQSGKAV